MNKRQAKKCRKHWEHFMVERLKHGFWKELKVKRGLYLSPHKNWRKQYRWIFKTCVSDIKKMERKG